MFAFFVLSFYCLNRPPAKIIFCRKKNGILPTDGIEVSRANDFCDDKA